MKKAILLLILTVFQACAPNSGNGSEIGNARITGSLVQSDNTPASGVTIRLFRDDHVPVNGSTNPISITLTDKNGIYSIVMVDSGTYNIIGESENDKSVFIKGIQIGNIGDITIPAYTVTAPGKVKGVSFMPGLDSVNQIRVTMYIPGTDFYTKPFIGGTFSFSKVPAGSYTLIFDPTDPDYLVKLITINVPSGGVADLDTVMLNKY
jgi:hypothetical protein